MLSEGQLDEISFKSSHGRQYARRILEGLPGASIPVIKINKINKEEIIKADQELIVQVNPQEAAMSKYNTQIHGNVQGFIQGDNAQVEMTFRDKPLEK
jgi:hypothetical protein